MRTDEDNQRQPWWMWLLVGFGAGLVLVLVAAVLWRRDREFWRNQALTNRFFRNRNAAYLKRAKSYIEKIGRTNDYDKWLRDTHMPLQEWLS